MYRIVSEVCDLLRSEGQVAIGRSEARLAVLVVTDQLADVLSREDISALSEALPLELTLALTRRRDSSQRIGPTQLPPDQVRAVCHVLGARVGGSLQMKLRLDVPPRVGTPPVAVRPSMLRPTVPSFVLPRKKAV